MTVHPPIVPGPLTARALDPPHPFVYTLLNVPFGAVGGYVTVAMVFLATKNGMSPEAGASLAVVSLLPQTWKFFWAPVVDLTLTRKWWYIISAAMCAAGVIAMSAMPLEDKGLPAINAAIFLASLASSFLGMSLEGLVAHATPPEQRGRVGGWFQAGNLGGNGLGGGAGLWMATTLPAPWMSGAVLGAVFLAGCGMLAFVPVPKEVLSAEDQARPISSRVFEAIAELGRDLWKIVRSRRGFVCALLCALPIGTGAATNVLSEAGIAKVWGVGADTVASVNGVMNGLISAFGCLVGGEICARFSSRRAYVVFGLLMAAVAAGMALSPFAPWSYVTFILAYAFVTGLAYAAFTGFVLEAIGKGAAATKYNAFASLSNTPIAYMTWVLAWAFSRPGWGAKGMLLTEAGAGVLGVVVLVGVVGAVMAVTRSRGSGLPLCPHCKYDRTGLAEGAVCPECGTAPSA